MVPHVIKNHKKIEETSAHKDKVGQSWAFSSEGEGGHSLDDTVMHLSSLVKTSIAGVAANFFI
jgi:hypothetical protein